MPPKAAPDTSESVAVTVAVRVRPFNDREKKANSKGCIDFPSGPQTIRISPPLAGGAGPDTAKGRTFTFDFAYKSAVGQRQLYLDLGVPLLRAAFDGFNACIFAYGQTGSGKSFAMMGPVDAAHVLPQGPAVAEDGEPAAAPAQGEEAQESGLLALRGIIPRLAADLFAQIIERQKANEEERERAKTTGAIVPKVEFEVQATYLEIYQERVRCLQNSAKANLKIRQHQTQGVFVEDLTHKTVKTFADVMHVISSGNDVRQVAATAMNAVSSRSHAVFSLILNQTFTTPGVGDDGQPKDTVSLRRSQINMVDLAGSERAKSTGAEGETLKEGALINKSLTTLGLVISGLADQAKNAGKPGGKEAFIPYRDSQLTFLLKENLGGNSKTFMLSALSPADINYEETLSTLRYADRAKAIVTKATVNEDSKDKLIRELQQEVLKYKTDLDELARLRELVAQQQAQLSARPSTLTEQSQPASPRGRQEVEDAEAAVVLLREMERKTEEDAAAAAAIAVAPPATAVPLDAVPAVTVAAPPAPPAGPYMLNDSGVGSWLFRPLNAGEAAVFGFHPTLDEALSNVEDETERARITALLDSLSTAGAPPAYISVRHDGVAPVHCIIAGEAPSGHPESSDGSVPASPLPGAMQVRVYPCMARDYDADAYVSSDEDEDFDAGKTMGSMVAATHGTTFVDASILVTEPMVLRPGQTVQLGSEFVSLKFVDPTARPVGNLLKKRLRSMTTARGAGSHTARGPGGGIPLHVDPAAAEPSPPAAPALAAPVTAEPSAAASPTAAGSPTLATTTMGPLNFNSASPSPMNPGRHSGEESIPGPSTPLRPPVVAASGAGGTTPPPVVSAAIPRLALGGTTSASTGASRAPMVVPQLNVAAAAPVASTAQDRMLPGRMGTSTATTANAFGPTTGSVTARGPPALDPLEPNHRHTFILLGDCGVGKTALRQVLGRDYGLFEGMKGKKAPVTQPTLGVGITEYPDAGGANKADVVVVELSGHLTTVFQTLQQLVPERRATLVLCFDMTDAPGIPYFKPYVELIQRAAPSQATRLMLLGTHRDDVLVQKVGSTATALATDSEVLQMLLEVQDELMTYWEAVETRPNHRPQIVGRVAVSSKDRTAIWSSSAASGSSGNMTARGAAARLGFAGASRDGKEQKMSHLLSYFADHAMAACRADPEFTNAMVPHRVLRLREEVKRHAQRGVVLMDATTYKEVARVVDSRFGDAQDLLRHTQLLHAQMDLYHAYRSAELKTCILLDPMWVFRSLAVFHLAAACARADCFSRAVPPPPVPPPVVKHFAPLPFTISAVRALDGALCQGDVATGAHHQRGPATLQSYLTLAAGVMTQAVATEIFRGVLRERGLGAGPKEMGIIYEILTRFDLILPSDRIAIYMPNPAESASPDGLQGALVSFETAADELRAAPLPHPAAPTLGFAGSPMGAPSVGMPGFDERRFYVTPSAFSRPASEVFTVYVPSLLRWSGGRLCRFSLNSVPPNFLSRLLCRLSALCDGVYVGPLAAIARRTGGGATDRRPFWNDAAWLITTSTSRVLLRLVRNSIFVIFYDVETLLSARFSPEDDAYAAQQEALAAAGGAPAAADAGGFADSDSSAGEVAAESYDFTVDPQVPEPMYEDLASYLSARNEQASCVQSHVQDGVLNSIRSVLGETPGVVLREYQQTTLAGESEGVLDFGRAPMTARDSSGWVLKGQMGVGTARGPAPAPFTARGANPLGYVSTGEGEVAGSPTAGTVCVDASNTTTEDDLTASVATRFTLDAGRFSRGLQALLLLRDEEQQQLNASLTTIQAARDRLRMLEAHWFMKAQSDPEATYPSESGSLHGAEWRRRWRNAARECFVQECLGLDAFTDVLAAVSQSV